MSWVIKPVLMATCVGELPHIKRDWPKCPECKEGMEPALGTWNYTESGRDDIYLENVYIWTCGQGHWMPQIPKVKELQRKIKK